MEHTKVSITQAIRIAVHRIRKNPNVSILFIGAPGTAKTAMAKQVAKLLDRPFRGVKVTHKSPEMLNGYPYLESLDGERKHLDFSDPGDWWPRKSGELLFIDEIGHASTAVQNVIMSVPEIRRMGDHDLPEDTAILMAANGGEHRAGSSTLHTAFMSRFDVVLDIEPTKEEWLDHAMSNGFHPMLIAGVSKVFDKVVDFDPKTKRGFLTLRTLEQASEAIYDYDGDPNHPDLKVCLYSCLGSNWASVLLGFMETYQSLPEYTDIVADPDGTNVEIAMVEPIAKSIASNVRFAHCAKVVRYISRYPTEQQAAFITMLPDAVCSHPDVEQLAESLGLNKSVNGFKQ